MAVPEEWKAGTVRIKHRFGISQVAHDDRHLPTRQARAGLARLGLARWDISGSSRAYHELPSSSARIATNRIGVCSSTGGACTEVWRSILNRAPRQNTIAKNDNYSLRLDLIRRETESRSVILHLRCQNSVAEIAEIPRRDLRLKYDISQREIEVGQKPPAAMMRTLTGSIREKKCEIT